MRRLGLLLIIVALLVTACGNWAGAPKGGNPAKIAVLNWEKALAAHPRYGQLQAAKFELAAAQKLRDDQIASGKKQLELLQKLTEMKQQGQKSFMAADYALKMSELKIKERQRLQTEEKKLLAASEAEVAVARKEIENAYRERIVNLRLKLEALKLTKEEHQALAAELNRLTAEQRAKLHQVELARRQTVAAKLRPQLIALEAQMSKESLQVQEELMAKATGISEADKKRLAKGPEELGRLLEILNKKVDQKQKAYDELSEALESDLTGALQKVTNNKDYDLVISHIKVNISATDLTEQVVTELKNITK